MANESINNDKNPSLEDDPNEKRKNTSPLYWPKKKEEGILPELDKKEAKCQLL